MAIQDSHPLDQGDFPQPSSVEMSLYPIMSLLQSRLTDSNITQLPINVLINEHMNSSN